jgi:hypothetical protein
MTGFGLQENAMSRTGSGLAATRLPFVCVVIRFENAGDYYCRACVIDGGCNDLEVALFPQRLLKRRRDSREK